MQETWIQNPTPRIQWLSLYLRKTDKEFKPVDQHGLVTLKGAFKDPTVHDCRRLAMNHPMGDRLVGLAEVLLTGR